MAKISIIGAGSWGTALARLLAVNGHDVVMWSIVEDEIRMLQENHEHLTKLPGVKLPDDIIFTTDMECAVKGKDILVLAVPSPYTRSTSKTMAPYVEDGQIIVSVAKGIEESTLKVLADVIKEDSPQAVKELQNMGIHVVMLTGDNERTAKAIGAQAGVLLLGAAELAVLEDEPPQPARDSSMPADSTAASARDSFFMVHSPFC